uniref:Auxin efflux carrier component n=1 Tax=Paramoeba aestuarina TaxID=180227 RepID=A0A7S4NUN2_9EUKA|mmetsp:Transcript_29142/g.45077  ORF Transcript_29142/g.45077 Transcript_29142/m.45077 type:complete len:216 (+) Transcript_29142:3-650(+)
MEQEGEAQEAGLEKIWAKFKKIVTKIPPPVQGIIVGAFVGLTPLQYFFFPPTHNDETSEGGHFPRRQQLVLEFGQYFGTLFVDTLDTLSPATVPLSLMVLGSSLAFGFSTISTLGTKIILTSCALKLLIMPFFSALLLVVVANFVGGSLQTVDLLCLLLPTAMPPATNLIILTNIHKAQNAECAAIILFNFIFSFVSIPVVALVFAAALRSIAAD